MTRRTPRARYVNDTPYAAGNRAVEQRSPNCAATIIIEMRVHSVRKEPGEARTEGAQTAGEQSAEQRSRGQARPSGKGPDELIKFLVQRILVSLQPAKSLGGTCANIN